MYVTLVYVKVKESHIDTFINVTRANHNGSIKEAGNRRFDILQSATNPAEFVLYEAFASEQDARAHKGTPHYTAWKAAVEEWMAEPRKGIVYNGLFPK